MTDDNIFYVYQYLREDGTPYYIGKGKDNRAFSNGGRPCTTPKDKKRIIIISDNLTENEAFNLERELIAKHGRKDLNTGVLYNKTDGGEGSSGWVASDETRAKMSAASKGKNIGKIRSKETRAKISAANKGKPCWAKGKKLGTKHRAKISESLKGRKEKPEVGILRGKAISAAKKGIPKSEEHKRKISEKLRGNTNNKEKFRSEEHKRKISEKLRGNTNSKGKLRSKVGRATYTPIELNPDLFEIIE